MSYRPLPTDGPEFCKQSGNVLFLILIAVALFAALSYVVTYSQRGSGSAGTEKASLIAAEIVQATMAMRTGFERMVIGGMAAEAIRLPANSSCFGECTTGKNCLFSPTGGGVIRPMFPKVAQASPPAAPNYYPSNEIWRCYVGVNDTFVNSAVGVTGIGLDVSGSPPNAVGTDALVYVGWLKKDICQAINNGLGISGIPSQPSHSAVP